MTPDSQFQPHEYAFVGALMVATVSLAGSIFIAESYMLRGDKRAAEERYVCGTERLILSINEAKEGMLRSFTLQLAYLRSESGSFSVADAKLNINLVQTLQELYAPNETERMNSVSDAYQKWNKLRHRLKKQGDVAGMELLASHSTSFGNALRNLEFAVLLEIKERKLIA